MRQAAARHGRDGIEDMEYDMDTARRGWLEPGDVANTRDRDGIRELPGSRR